MSPEERSNFVNPKRSVRSGKDKDWRAIGPRVLPPWRALSRLNLENGPPRTEAFSLGYDRAALRTAKLPFRRDVNLAEYGRRGTTGRNRQGCGPGSFAEKSTA
jgi:hypothetical protein